MKKLLFILFLSLGNLVHSQEGLRIGAELSPAWHVNIQQQISTGLLSNTNGYGFNVGVPVRFGFSETLSLQTGLTFELMMFDDRVNKTLISSNRHGSLHMPLMLNYMLAGEWYVSFGTGFNFNLMNTLWTQFGKINISSATNRFQPYGALGLSTMMEQDKGDLEIGVVGRFHFIDMYKNTGSSSDFTNWIMSIDLALRYYLFRP